jgi:hypothetical protein
MHSPAGLVLFQRSDWARSVAVKVLSSGSLDLRRACPVGKALLSSLGAETVVPEKTPIRPASNSGEALPPRAPSPKRPRARAELHRSSAFIAAPYGSVNKLFFSPSIPHKPFSYNELWSIVHNFCSLVSPNIRPINEIAENERLPIEPRPQPIGPHPRAPQAARRIPQLFHTSAKEPLHKSALKGKGFSPYIKGPQILGI